MSSPELKQNIFKNLVLSGGGVKGICHIGVLQSLEDNGVLSNIQSFAGTSIGSMILGLYLVGYSVQELRKLSMTMDFDIFKKSISLHTFINEYGFDSGETVEYVLKEMIQKKTNTNITLIELHQKTKKNFTIVGTNVSKSRVEYLNHMTRPNMPLWLAIRISTSIPLFYKPVQYDGDTYVDGGLLYNFPIHLYKNQYATTLGVLIRDKPKEHIDSLQSYLSQIIDCVLYSKTNDQMMDYPNIVEISMPEHHLINFDLNVENKQQIFQKGYDETLKVLMNNSIFVITQLLDEIIQSISNNNESLY